MCGLFSCPPGAVSVARADSGSHSSGCGALRQGQSLLPTQPAQSAVSGCRGRRSRRRFQTRAAHGSQAGKSPGTPSVQPVPRWPRRGVGVCISERLLVTSTAAGTQSHPELHGCRPRFPTCKRRVVIGTRSGNRFSGPQLTPSSHGIEENEIPGHAADSKGPFQSDRHIYTDTRVCRVETRNAFLPRGPLGERH